MGACVKISFDGIVRNAVELRKAVGPFYCVLKCDAYGHGAVKCVDALYDAGFRDFAVFSLEEALEIKRRIGDAEILILGRTPARYSDALVKNGFVQTVFSKEYAEELAPVSAGLRAHIKLDSGMNRVGFKCEPEQIKNVFSGFKGEIEGVYTHFHSADCPDLKQTETELAEFINKTAELENGLGKKLKRHAAASAAAIRLPSARLDACRIGLALYGVLPDNCEIDYDLAPAMSLTVPVIDVRCLKKGENIGYGCDITVKRDTVAATVAAGYAMGLSRRLAGAFRPSINGNRVDVLGRICMDRCMLDVTELSGVKPYDTVEFFGDSVSVRELAECEKTIPYEILTRVGKMCKK